MAEDLVGRLKLKEYYKVESTGQAIGALQGATDISVSKEGVISVKVEDKDPKLAADMANAYVTSLDRMFARFGTTDASRQRAFIAERLEKTEKALRQAEESVRRFQESNKTIVLDAQLRAGLEAAAQARGQIAAAEVQLELMRSFATENNPQVIQQRKQIEEMKRQLAQMQYSRGLELPSESANPGQRRQEIYVPTARVPELAIALARLTRDVTVQATLFTVLTQQYEQAKIAEARDTPTVQLLDKAVPAERKSKPNVRLNMAIAGALSLFVGIFLAFFLEYLDRVRKHEAASTG